MIVTAALSWWNEPLETLEAVVSSVATLVDRIVAFDGAYRRYPGATASSAPAQWDMILDTAIRCGIEPRITVPSETWAGQCEKRTALMQEAAQGSDWVLVVDADYVVTADRERVREQLAAADLDVYEVPLVTPTGEYATNWHLGQALTPEAWTPLMFRALPQIMVEEHHWWYSGMKDGRRVWLWGDDERYPRLPHGRLSDITVTHNCALRSHEQVIAARSWYNDVMVVVGATGQEDAVDGLPDPVWETDRIPF